MAVPATQPATPITTGVYRKLATTLLPNLKNLDPGAVAAVGVLDPGNEHAFLGKDPNSESLQDLANGDLCLILGWSGDVAQARRRAAEAGNAVRIGYSIPVEGSLSSVDVLAIPSDAPHAANAHAFINHLLRPDVAARNSATVTYATGVAESRALLSEDLRNDAATFPTAQARARLVPMRARSSGYTRALMRTWTRFKTGS